jgi:hypothetical protein
MEAIIAARYAPLVLP